MSAPAFTPGPLHLRSSATPSANYNFHLYLADEGGRKLAALWGGSEEKLANGNLWAAAPELFEALMWCVENEGECLGDHPKRKLEALALIAKARGETS